MMQERILGDYKILKELGEGTVGKVLLAEHRFIKKPYALKVLPTELANDSAFVRRFEMEVSKLAALDHPNLVKIHTASLIDGIYILVTDCIVDSFGETTNLADYMLGRSGRLREEDLMRLLTQVADGLDYAHLKGQTAHGMLKLNNILVSKAKSNPDFFISDFGLSHIISPEKIILKTFQKTAEGLDKLDFNALSKETYSPIPFDGSTLSKLNRSFLQTFAFLAPEQKQLHQSGAPADVYAFGILTYYLISGLFPEGAFDLPSIIAPEYRHDWDALVKACLQRDPSKRPLQLLPLLEKKKAKEISIEPIQLARVQEEIKSEAAATIEQLKEKLKVAAPILVTPAPVRELVTAAKLDHTENDSFSQSIAAQFNRDLVVTQYQPEKKETETLEPIETEMSLIRGGEFFRGSNNGNRDEMPYHRVFVDSFAMDVHPVTNEQFVRFLEVMGGEKDLQYNDLIRLKDSRINRSSGRLSIESGYTKHPVVGVTWYGAVAYAKWIKKRLPTEAEWEIAARGGHEMTLYPTGETIDKSQANFFSSDTVPVMSFAPNKYGLYDMAGNVYEWCQDWYGYNFYETSLSEPHNPKGPAQGVYRVLRGGCWKSLKEDLRSSHRHRNNPGTMNSTYGFRCAADV